MGNRSFIDMCRVNQWPRESPGLAVPWLGFGAFTVVKVGAQVGELRPHRLCCTTKKKATHRWSKGLQYCHALGVKNESVCSHH